jgi:diamine N-acetyltransferase
MTPTNDKISLVPVEPEHLELLYKWENHPDVWRVSNTRVPLSKFALAKYIENSHRDIWESREQRLVIELNENKKAVGTIELFDFDPYHSRAGIGVMVFDAEDRRKGYASSAILLLMQYAKNELGIQQLYANIAQSNNASISMFEKLGFEQCGLKEKWLKTPAGWEGEYMYQAFL